MDQQTLSKQRGLAKSPDIILIAFKNLDNIPFTEGWTLFDWISYDPLPKRAGSRLQCEEWSITELLPVLKEAQVAFLKCQKDSISIDGFRLREEIRLKLMDTIGTSNSLTSVTIDRVEGSDLLALCRSLGANTVLQELSISWPWYCREDGVQFVCEMLNKNSTLRRLSLRRSYVGATGAAFLATMLRENSTLKRLSLWGNPLGPEGVQFLLKPLVANNASLTHLEIGGFENRMGSSGTHSVAEVLNSNSTLIELVISYEDSMSPEALCCIFKSLEKSKSLQVLDLSFCDGVRGEVFPSIMDLLQVNHWLKTINLTETPLEREGLEAAVRAQLERNAQKHVTVMRELPVTHPTSARIFLCGHAFSGKTTLGRSMVRSFATDVCTKMVRPLLELIEVRKPSGCFTDPNEWATRTHGIEIKVLVDDGKHKISIWDLAGQEEYQVFHDFMIPDLSTQGSPCCFLLLCNPFERESGQQKQFEVIKQELSYWVRFISSNTRRSMACQPQVAVVLTHCDKPIVGKEVVKKHVEMLKNDFQNYLNMSLNTYFVNAHSSREVKTLAEDVRSTCIKILGLLPHVYEACVHMRYALSQWNKKHPDQPMITKQSFDDHFFPEKERSLRPVTSLECCGEEEAVEKMRKAVAMSLHEAGELIYFENESFVIVNPQWLFQGVMSPMFQLRNFFEASSFDNGFVDTVALAGLLERSLHQRSTFCFGKGVNYLKPLNMQASDLIQLMLRLGLCYEADEPNATSNPRESMPSNSRVFIPTALKDFGDCRISKGERKLQWHWDWVPDQSLIYVGQRLECADARLTTLTPGFFPKLQVELHNYICSQLQNMSPLYENEKNFVRVILGGIEILVELSGNLMGSLFIYVLVKSSHSHTQTLELVHKHVVSQIQNLCHSPKGCIGVVLVESILRPACVENLLLCKYRKEQAVLVETLKNELLAASTSQSYVHPFRGIDDGETKILGVGSSDLAVVLLGEKYTNEVLDRRLSELTKLDVDMDRQISNVDDTNLEVTTESIPPIASSFQSRLSNDHDDIQEIKRLIKDEGKKTRDVVEECGKKVVIEIKENRRLQIEFMENCLQKKLYTKLDRVINLSLQLQQRQVPCNFFFTTKDIGVQRKLIVKLLPGYSVVKLHLLCEHLDGIHVIKDQQGVEVFLANGQHAKHIRSLITIGLTIFSLLLKTGAHILAGIGDMIPNIGKGVALALDSQILSDYLPPSFSSTLRPLPVPTNMIEEARHDERNGAEQWLVNFLKGQNIWNSFSLTRVHYTKVGSVRWVCKDHREKGKCNGIMEDLPV